MKPRRTPRKKPNPLLNADRVDYKATALLRMFGPARSTAARTPFTGGIASFRQSCRATRGPGRRGAVLDSSLPSGRALRDAVARGPMRQPQRDTGY